MERPILCLPGPADTYMTVPERHVKSGLRSARKAVLHPDRRSWSMCAQTHLQMYIHVYTHVCKADPVTFLWGLALGQLSAELHVINYEQNKKESKRERDIYASKAAVKPLVSCFPFNVKRPPQRKTSTISTLLCCLTRLRLPTHSSTGVLWF